MQHQLIGHDAAKSAVTFREMRTAGNRIIDPLAGTLTSPPAVQLRN